MLARTAYAAPLRLLREVLPALIIIAAAAAGTRAQSPPPPFKISALKAMLFYDNTGEFSADVAAADDGLFLVPSILWNTPIEGASRVGASTSLLVTVAVTGETQYQPLPRRIVLTARYIPFNRSRQPIVITKTAAISIGEGGKFIAGFWLDETGCNPVKLSARIVGQRGDSVLKKIVKFGCGE